ncbi:hypothetical protein BOSEA31B_12761 [Hyphomicrobiales bacterium]|nr:hypothetical protein BOSEA31B_12761 [Hyphomicrobiales bacterium]CAH1698533.1 hypothetical protein BOSEA1005_11587 [Hyphomicrobiales bacterium]CAI0342181.1 hypothetical protein BO1005MUT1_170137 [Hyphomicrobiales bacterium]
MPDHCNSHPCQTGPNRGASRVARNTRSRKPLDRAPKTGMIPDQLTASGRYVSLADIFAAETAKHEAGTTGPSAGTTIREAEHGRDTTEIRHRGGSAAERRARRQIRSRQARGLPHRHTGRRPHAADAA